MKGYYSKIFSKLTEATFDEEIDKIFGHKTEKTQEILNKTEPTVKFSPSSLLNLINPEVTKRYEGGFESSKNTKKIDSTLNEKTLSKFCQIDYLYIDFQNVWLDIASSSLGDDYMQEFVTMLRLFAHVISILQIEVMADYVPFRIDESKLRIHPVPRGKIFPWANADDWLVDTANTLKSEKKEKCIFVTTDKELTQRLKAKNVDVLASHMFLQILKTVLENSFKYPSSFESPQKSDRQKLIQDLSLENQLSSSHKYWLQKKLQEFHQKRKETEEYE